MKKFILFTLLVFTVTSVFAAKKIPNPKHTKTKTSLPAFSSIHVTGFVKVIIHGTNSKSPKSTAVTSHHSNQVSIKIRHHTLYIRSLKSALPRRKASIVKVRMYRLNKLDVYGRASVTAKNIKSDGLYLRADTIHPITLDGILIVDRIINYGPSKIKIRWVKGKAISIRSMAGRITLAGNVAELRAKLRNHAVLDAQYLRTQHALIQAKDYATAKIQPVQSLRAFASDNSNVYFYKNPEHISRNTSGSGNILQLGEVK